MSQWSGSQYKGPLENGWYQGFGKFFYPNGVVYEGNFDKGEFHGDGIIKQICPINLSTSNISRTHFFNTLIYPNGGRYVAKWDRGKLLEGNYFFYDKLEYNDGSWDYCTIKDRSFYTEKLKGLRPDGLTLITNDIKGPKNVPQGTYDIGDFILYNDGYYDPTKRALYEYDGSFKRDLDQNEEQWIVEKCRYQPKKYEDDSHLDGGGDKIIKEMIKLNQNPTLKQARESKGQ